MFAFLAVAPSTYQWYNYTTSILRGEQYEIQFTRRLP